MHKGSRYSPKGEYFKENETKQEVLFLYLI